MIFCEKCKNWYHGSCVGINENDGETIQNFVCPSCAKLGTGSITFKGPGKRPVTSQQQNLTKQKPETKLKKPQTNLVSKSTQAHNPHNTHKQTN